MQKRERRRVGGEEGGRGRTMVVERDAAAMANMAAP
jgi:hypothetical protein